MRRIELHALVSRTAIAHEYGDFALGLAIFLLFALNFRSRFSVERALEALGFAVIIPIAPIVITCELLHLETVTTGRKKRKY